MSEEHILQEVITGYRKVINQRYQYHSLQKKFTLPDSFDEATVNVLRNYFLDYVYPQVEKREELNQVFDSLDSYIRQPGKLLRILVESVKLSFKYGRHLPKILSTGLKAFRSFKAATDFENKLVEKAIENHLAPPYDLPKIHTLIKLLPREEIEHFIDSSQSLFETIHDRELVEKMKEILGHLIVKMKQRPNRYSSEEINALEMGFEILSEGDQLFNRLEKEDQDQLAPLIIQIERSTLDEIFLAEQ